MVVAPNQAGCDVLQTELLQTSKLLARIFTETGSACSVPKTSWSPEQKSMLCTVVDSDDHFQEAHESEPCFSTNGCCTKRILA
jgi:hypothetical protein